MDSKSTYLTAAVATVVAVGLAAYAVYFDYKRRHDTEFRKKLKKEKKRIEKSVSQLRQNELAESNDISTAVLLAALQQIRTEKVAETNEEKETIFMSQITIGEQLAAQGPKFYLPCALAFFRALRVYPKPYELINIYQGTVPEPIFKMITLLSQLDIKRRVEVYYDHFPPERMNISVEMMEVMPGQGDRQVLVVDKDFAAGSVIYKEFPVVAALDSDLHSKGTHCDQCLRSIESGMSFKMPKESTPTPFQLTYCSKHCMLDSKRQSNDLLFSLESFLPPGMPYPPMPPRFKDVRREAQAKFAEYIRKDGRSVPLLVARFIARQVNIETQKMGPAAGDAAPENNFTDSEDVFEAYTLADHLERLRYLETNPKEEESQLLTRVLYTALPGLENFLADGRYATLVGKMAYNAIGVCFGGGRDDKPKPAARPENVEKTRTPYGTQRQIGSAFYTVSSYLTHSCNPSARPSFSSGTTEISIIANRDLKKGDILTIAFVDVTQGSDESPAQCRRRRRKELVRGWKLPCTCDRCLEEAKLLTSEEKAKECSEIQRDESKVEDTLKTFPFGGSSGVFAPPERVETVE